MLTGPNDYVETRTRQACRTAGAVTYILVGPNDIDAVDWWSVEQFREQKELEDYLETIDSNPQREGHMTDLSLAEKKQEFVEGARDILGMEVEPLYPTQNGKYIKECLNQACISAGATTYILNADNPDMDSVEDWCDDQISDSVPLYEYLNGINKEVDGRMFLSMIMAEKVDKFKVGAIVQRREENV